MIETRVKALIKDKGLLQKTVAETAGYSERTFSRMLNSHTPIRDADVWKIAQALGVTPNELYESANHKENSRQVKIQFVIGDKVIGETAAADIKALLRAYP